MKKTKLLTSLAALALVVGLGACETGDININVEGDVNVGVGGSSESTTDTTDTEPEEPSTGNTDDDGDGDGENNPSQPSEEEQLQKELEKFQEVLKGLGGNPFSGWEAYKYTLDETTKLIKEGEDGYPFGYYRLAEDEVSYFVNGQNYYSGYDGSYETFELTETYQDQLKEDGSFFSLETLLSLTSDDVLSLTNAEDTYEVSYESVEGSVVSGTTTSTYTLSLTINENELVNAKCDTHVEYTAGSYGTDSEEEKSESIEKVDPETITLDLLIEEGFNSDLWVKETGPVLLGTFDWTGFTDGDNSTSNVTIALTVAQLEDNLSRAWQPKDVFTGHSYSVTSTSNMRAGSHNNVNNCDLVGSLECITFGNGRSTTGSMVLTFDESVNITKVEVVDVLGSTTSNNLTVNGQAQAGYDYKNVTNWNSGAKWEDVPAVVYDDIEQGNILSMSLTQSASADKIIVHSIAIYGTIGESTTEPEEEVEEELELPNYTLTFGINGFTDEGEEVYWNKAVFTEDAVVIEYYTDYDELLGNGEHSYQDKEVYLNTEKGCDVFMLWDWYTTDLHYENTVEGTYLDVLGGSLLDLRGYESYFVEGETTSTDRGNETPYTINGLSDSDFLEVLLDGLFDNYFKSYELLYDYESQVEGLDDLLEAGQSLENSLVYISDVDTYEFIFSDGTYTFTAYLYDIGTSVSTVDDLNLVYDSES